MALRMFFRLVSRSALGIGPALAKSSMSIWWVLDWCASGLSNVIVECGSEINKDRVVIQVRVHLLYVAA